MNSVFILHHSYETGGHDEANSAVQRLKNKPGFCDRPDAFVITEYELNQDNWTEGYSTMTTIEAKDIYGNWKSVADAVRIDGSYEIVEKYENESLGEFKDGDVVICESRDDILYAVEKVSF